MFNCRTSSFLAGIVIAFGTHVSSSHASLTDFASNTSNLTDLEIAAANANQAVYDELLALGCTDNATSGSGACSDGVFQVWQNVRELVHTANDILGNSGPTFFSLGVDAENLGFSLRWTAAEEVAAQQSLSDGFASAQLANLSSRIGAIRGGTRGVASNRSPTNTTQWLSGLNAGDATEAWSRWGGFVNASYTDATHDPTQRENAYEMTGTGFDFGLDYRIDDQWVVGAVAGLREEDIEFDSTLSIVDGNIEVSGWSLMPFALYQRDASFASFSLGYQQSEYDTRRAITYTSLNPNTNSVNTTALSSNESNTLLLNVAAGYAFDLGGGSSLEPGIALDYQSQTIDAFTERDILNDGFGFEFEEQDVDTLEAVLSVVARTVWSGSRGIMVPHLGLEAHAIHRDQSDIKARYKDLGSSATSTFTLKPDDADSNYLVYNIGFSAVITGASEGAYGEPATGGVQVFIDYRYFDQFDDYEQSIATAGLRYEF